MTLRSAVTIIASIILYLIFAFYNLQVFSKSVFLLTVRKNMKLVTDQIGLIVACVSILEEHLFVNYDFYLTRISLNII